MERERAILVETMLSGDMSPPERQSRIDVARTRLIDLERMVLRDKSLVGQNTPAVRAAFENYDLTFLVHASTEKNRSLADHLDVSAVKFALAEGAGSFDTLKP